MTKHKHKWHLKECRIDNTYEKVEGNKKLTKEKIMELLKIGQIYIKFYEEVAIFICECGKKKEVLVK